MVPVKLHRVYILLSKLVFSVLSKLNNKVVELYPFMECLKSKMAAIYIEIVTNSSYISLLSGIQTFFSSLNQYVRSKAI